LITPLPTVDCSFELPKLTISRVSEDPDYVEGILIWNPSDMFWQEKFDYFGSLDDTYEDDLEILEKT